MKTLIIVLVFFVTYSALTHLAKYNYLVWKTVVLFTVAWVFADVIDKLSRVGIIGDFEVKIRLWRLTGVLKVPRLALAFGIYFLVIVILAFADTLIHDWTLQVIGFFFGKSQVSDDFISTVSFLVAFLVLADLYYRNRDRNRESSNT